MAAHNGSRERQNAQSAQPTSTRMFASDAGVVLNFIKADKTHDFEEIVQKLREALRTSTEPARKQAASWKVFRAVEPAANGSVLYLFVIDPAVKGQDTVRSCKDESTDVDLMI